MPVTAADVQLEQVLVTARTYLNDDNATQFPDPVLIPKAQEAHRELQEELWICGSPVVRGFQIVAYTANATSITGPTDLLCPTVLYENAQSSTQTSAGWTPMTECFFLPLGVAVNGTSLGYWAWQQEVIQVIGCSVNRAIGVQYRRQLLIPSLTTDLIGILFGESYLAARAAAMAAGSVGNAEVYTALSALAKENLAKVISANRGQQKPLLKP